MTVTLESTTKIVPFNGFTVRIWEGVTASGIPCHAYVFAIAAQEDLDEAALRAELTKHKVPSPNTQDLVPRIFPDPE